MDEMTRLCRQIQLSIESGNIHPDAQDSCWEAHKIAVREKEERLRMEGRL